MRSSASGSWVVLVAVVGLGFGPAAAVAQSPATLTVGRTTTGKVSGREGTVYRFEAPDAGVLSVAVHSDSDVTLTVTDEDGQALPDGSSDQDLFGAGGNCR